MKVYITIEDLTDILKESDDPVYLRAKNMEEEPKGIILQMSYAQYLELFNNEALGCFQVDYKEEDGKYAVNFINKVWEETRT